EVSRSARVFEEVRRDAEVRLEAHHPRAHPAEGGAEVDALLELVVEVAFEGNEVRAAAEVPADVRGQQPICRGSCGERDEGNHYKSRDREAVAHWHVVLLEGPFGRPTKLNG